MHEAEALLRQVLGNPVVQASAVPFAVGLVCALLLYPARLEGLSAVLGFLAAVLVSGTFALQPLTDVRRIVVVGAAAALAGALSDFAFKPTRFSAPTLGLVFGIAALWVFATVLGRKLPVEVVVLGAGLVAYVVWLVSATVTLQLDPARAGATSLTLALGTGVSATFGASTLLGHYGVALGAACGGFILLLMILGPRASAGHALTLPASVLCALLGAGAVLLARLTPFALLPLALVPVAARLPLARAPLWTQPLLAGVYTGVPAAGACALAWLAARGWRW